MAITVDELSSLAGALIDADLEVDKAEEKLKEAKEYARTIREETIPAAMQEMGVESITLNTGQKLSVKQEVYAQIPSAQKAQAYKWLDDNGFGGIIKISVKVDYGKGEQEDAVALMEELQARGLNADGDQAVNAMTLKAFLKEQISKGTDIPLELFGARPVWQAKISNK